MCHCTRGNTETVFIDIVALTLSDIPGTKGTLDNIAQVKRDRAYRPNDIRIDIATLFMGSAVKSSKKVIIGLAIIKCSPL